MDAKCSRLLEETSRTFHIPIMRLPERLRNAVASAYLCLRAIDEIEDHPVLDASTKTRLLRGIAELFAEANDCIDETRLAELLGPHARVLPEVSMSTAKLADLAPHPTRAQVYGTTARMAAAMADWVACSWRIQTKEELDRYTFDVAGRVGLLLSNLWNWHDGIECDNEHSVGFGRSLQAVNIVRNRSEDLERGADFFPDGWEQRDMIGYARRQMKMASAYMEELPPGAIFEFCAIPLELAKATLEAIENGYDKLSRAEVNNLISGLGLFMEE